MPPVPRGKTVVAVGAGGNIGSHLVPHLARTPGVGRIVLVDGDVYGASNLWSQQIRRRDLGRPKVAVQRRVLREIDTTLAVVAIAARVEDVPLGHLRGDVLLSAVDSKAARRTINAIATRLGMPWIDAGVNGDASLARVTVYRTGDDEPCHECAWDVHDYATVHERAPCSRDATAAPTNAPSSLGALAAAVQALACRHVLAEAWAAARVGCEVVLDAAGLRMLVSTLRRNPRCRFDHARWSIAPHAIDVAACTVADAFALARRTLDTRDDVAITIAGQLFATRLSCLSCDTTRTLAPYLFARLGPVAAVCDACRQPMRLGGFDAFDWLRPADVPAELHESPLTSLGIRPGDVVTVSDAHRTAHLECGGPS